jgi:hypothetical protein
MNFPLPPSRCQQITGNRHGKIIWGPYAGFVTVYWDRRNIGPTVSRNTNGTVEPYVPLTDIRPEES